jgi:hypothetical protein
MHFSKLGHCRASSLERFLLTSIRSTAFCLSPHWKHVSSSVNTLIENAPMPGQSGKGRIYGFGRVKFKKRNPPIPALKAPAHASPGSALGYVINRSFGALRGRRVLRPFRADNVASGDISPGRCPGLASSAPLARHRTSAFKRRKLPTGIYEIVCSEIRRSLLRAPHSSLFW